MRGVHVLGSCLLVAIASAGFAWAESNNHGPAPHQLYGSIVADRTLTAPTYYVLGDVTIEPGVTLVIERGVTLVMTAKADFLASGVDAERCEIIVRGILRVPAGAGETRIISTLDAQQDNGIGSWYGIRVRPGGYCDLTSATLRGAKFAVDIEDGGRADLVNSSFGNVTYGILSSQSASGKIEGCLLGNTTRTVGIGIRLFSGVTTASPDSFLPTPTLVQGFTIGVQLGRGSYCRNVAAIYNTYGFYGSTSGNRAGIDYCTAWLNDVGVAGCDGAIDVWNSIIAGANGTCAVEGCQGGVSLYRSDVWDMFDGARLCNAPRIVPPVAVFDPGFASGGFDVRLGAQSLFTDYSVSGGEIGAYGPGLIGGPTPVAGVSLVSAECVDGIARLVWFASRGGKSTVFRRVSGRDWVSLAPVETDGRGHVRYEDRSVTPGTRYCYGVGVVSDTGVEIQGQAWLDIPGAPQVRLHGARPNPITKGPVTVSFELSGTGDATLELIDLSGRRMGLERAGDVGPGRHSVVFSSSSSLPSGTYWVRLSQGGRNESRKVVVSR